MTAQILGDPKVSAFPLSELLVHVHALFTKWRVVAQVRQTQSEGYKQGSWPISTLLFDNIDYGQHFAVEVLPVRTPASVCHTHLTCTAATNLLLCLANLNTFQVANMQLGMGSSAADAPIHLSLRRQSHRP